MIDFHVVVPTLSPYLTATIQHDCVKLITRVLQDNIFTLLTTLELWLYEKSVSSKKHAAYHE